MRLLKKYNWHLLIILLVLFFVFKSYHNYSVFNESNIPVFDGVMNEYSQIRRYENFKDDFSFIERFNQTVYEFKGNVLSPGFSIILTAFFPSTLVNDYDIIVRAIIIGLIFSFSLFSFLNTKLSKLDSVIVLILILNLPFFYHFRYGIVTYIPEISSTLLIVSGVLRLVLFKDRGEISNLYLGVSLILLSVIFRMNFVVYAFFTLLPFTFILYREITTLKLKTKLNFFIYLLIIGIITSVYFISKLDSFLDYYNSDSPYAIFTISKALRYQFVEFYRELQWVGILTLIFIPYFVGDSFKSIKGKIGLFFPFIFFICLMLYLKADNVPHVFVVEIIFFILIVMFNSLFKFKRTKTQYALSIILILILNIYYLIDVKKNSNTIGRYVASREVVDYIIQNDKVTNYLCFYDEMVEVPINVKVYNNCRRFLIPSTHFYFHDMFWSVIDKDLNVDNIIDYYTKGFEKGNIDLIVINNDVIENKSFDGFSREKHIVNELYKVIKSNKNYRLDKVIKTNFHGYLEFYKLITT